jgi:predicted N-acetyltransferase YhbS
METIIRAEAPSDVEAIRRVIDAAFKDAPHTSHTEVAIVDALRAAGALSLSLVAAQGDDVVGHVAFSPVTIDGRDRGWWGLGPVAVRPDRQGLGIGQALIREGLRQLQARGVAGCVVLGEPAYYGRFGFVSRPTLRLAGVPAEYFQSLPLAGDAPQGEVAYHAGFEAK